MKACCNCFSRFMFSHWTCYYRSVCIRIQCNCMYYSQMIYGKTWFCNVDSLESLCLNDREASIFLWWHCVAVKQTYSSTSTMAWVRVQVELSSVWEQFYQYKALRKSMCNYLCTSSYTIFKGASTSTQSTGRVQVNILEYK